MTALADFRRYFAECPLVAIIRGVRPDEAEAIAGAIIDAGIRIVEVPLNSPDPLQSIELLAKRFGAEALIGAGTVLEPDQVDQVQRAGGRLIVSPSTDAGVIGHAHQASLVTAPGFFTPSEAFTAIRSGADALKLFPAEAASPAMVKSIRAVLPKDMPLLVVGGVRPEAARGWMEAGADGFGLGGAVYRAGQSPADTATAAATFVAALR